MFHSCCNLPRIQFYCRRGSMDNLGALLLVLVLLLEPHRPPTVLQPLILAAAVNVRQNTASNTRNSTTSDIRLESCLPCCRMRQKTSRLAWIHCNGMDCKRTKAKPLWREDAALSIEDRLRHAAGLPTTSQDSCYCAMTSGTPDPTCQSAPLQHS
jgi:hypothetical protein